MITADRIPEDRDISPPADASAERGAKIRPVERVGAKLARKWRRAVLRGEKLNIGRGHLENARLTLPVPPEEVSARTSRAAGL